MDLKFAVRSLRNNPAFTLLAVLVMALGIGANTAMFSVVNAVLLKPLPYPDPGRIVTILSKWKDDPVPNNISTPDFNDWHAETTAFSAMAYYQAFSTSVLAGSTAEYIQVARVSPEFYAALGSTPVAGRLFTGEENKPGGSGAALISYNYWQSHYAGSTRALGQSVRMFDRVLPIVGVLPPGFHYPDKTDIWFPADTIIREAASRGAHNYRGVGRLKPGAGLEQARAQLNSIASRLAQQYPQSNMDLSVAVTRLRDAMVNDVRPTLYLLLGAVGLVLLIACANIATLLLARATARTREIAVRAALGASRARILRQLIIENLLLSLLSAALGLILAVWGADVLVKLAPANVPRLAETGIDRWVLAFTFGVSILASLLFGLAPAFQASRVDLNEALKQGNARSVVGGGTGRIRATLVVAEMALSVMLLAGAGLLIKSFIALENAPLGYRPDHLLVLKTSVPVAHDKAGFNRAVHLYQRLLPELAAIPGVSVLGATNATPGYIQATALYSIDREEYLPNSPETVATVIAPATFAALGIPLSRGRDFDAGDVKESQPVAILNETLARKAFPKQDPIGHVIFCGFDSTIPMKIVGIVGAVRQTGPAMPPEPQLYAPYIQHSFYSTGMSVVARTALDPTTLFEPMRRKVRERAPDVSVKLTTMDALRSENIAPQWFRALLLGIFAALAVGLAMAGVYGVMACLVNQRSSEIGLRMALGASPADVSRLILRQALKLAAAGLAIGLIGALVAARLIAGMLFEVRPTDPMTYAAVAILLAAVASAASYLPARRASRVDPLVALRQE